MKIFGAICILGIAALTASADTVWYNNFGQTINNQDSVTANGSYIDPNGNNGIGPLFGSFSTDAGNGTGANLTTLSLSLYADSNQLVAGSAVDFSLCTDNGGPGPNGGCTALGSVLDSTIHDCASNGAHCTGAPSTVTLSGLDVALNDSTRYWIELSGDPTNDTTVLWNSNNDAAGTNVSGEYFGNVNAIFGNTQFPGDGPYVMSVSGTNNDPLPNSGAPEPSTFLLIGTGAIALGWLRRRSRAA
jgi:hypothetical protein